MNIYLLTDYKNNFGSKWHAKPYRSGFDKELLVKYFDEFGYEAVFLQFKDVVFNGDDFWRGKIVLYTSSEEPGLHYKSFIEDIVLGLELAGAITIPRYPFLRANNNKVFMEILKDQLLSTIITRSCKKYGTKEELISDFHSDNLTFPVVYKLASGAMSRNVFLAFNKGQLLRIVNSNSRTRHLRSEIVDIIRQRKHKGYKKESKYQGKFIMQQFIPELKNDWKVLVFGNHYYLLYRGIKPDDFRASGSHYDYRAGSDASFPVEMLDIVKGIYEKLEIPHLSVDIAYDGTDWIIHEFQALYFGTSTMVFSDDYYEKIGGEWVVVEKKVDQEKEYVSGVASYLKKHRDFVNK